MELSPSLATPLAAATASARGPLGGTPAAVWPVARPSAGPRAAPGEALRGASVLAAATAAAVGAGRRRQRGAPRGLARAPLHASPRMRERAPLLVDGQIILTDKTFEVRNPATGNRVGAAPIASEELIDAAIVGAHRAGPSWAALPNEKRRALLTECARILREDMLSLATLQTNESGRPIAETKLEIFVAAANFENAAKVLDIDNEEEVIEDRAPKRIVVKRSPIGVVAVLIITVTIIIS